MNWNIEPITRTRVTDLTDAEKDAVHAKLAADWQHAQVLIARCEAIYARLDARRYTVADVEASVARAKARHAARERQRAIRAAIQPFGAVEGKAA